MSKTHAIVAWSSFLSILLTGCYSSVLIAPTGKESERISSNRILYFITKDNVKHTFEVTPTVVGDSIVAEEKIPAGEGFVRQRVSFPLSEVATVSVRDFQPAKTALVSLSSLLFVAEVAVAISLGRRW
jgi:hypothetical protein